MRLVPLVMSGKNALLMAPTGTGKTEAAFLPILDNIIRNELARTRGIKLLYITPLRALNRDMLERMKWWCKRFDVRLGVRHGDTTSAERAGQSMAPPDILITTPETLQAMLTGRRIRESLTALRWVVIDEVHELAEDKRGSQLSHRPREAEEDSREGTSRSSASRRPWVRPRRSRSSWSGRARSARS